MALGGIGVELEIMIFFFLQGLVERYKKKKRVSGRAVVL